MMDAAVMSEEGMSFDDFQALFHSDSVADLGVYESGLSNGSVHGGNVLGSEEVPPQGSGAPQEVLGGHYHPKKGFRLWRGRALFPARDSHGYGRLRAYGQSKMSDFGFLWRFDWLVKLPSALECSTLLECLMQHAEG
eukprot:1160804-Pelagomonas_calceolata.AAC.11